MRNDEARSGTPHTHFSPWRATHALSSGVTVRYLLMRASKARLRP
jgi:hypothetical protein